MDTPQIFTSAVPEVTQVSLFAKEQQAKHPAHCDKCNIIVHSLYVWVKCKSSTRRANTDKTKTMRSVFDIPSKQINLLTHENKLTNKF